MLNMQQARAYALAKCMSVLVDTAACDHSKRGIITSLWAWASC